MSIFIALHSQSYKLRWMPLISNQTESAAYEHNYRLLEPVALWWIFFYKKYLKIENNMAYVHESMVAYFCYLNDLIFKRKRCYSSRASMAREIDGSVCCCGTNEKSDSDKRREVDRCRPAVSNRERVRSATPTTAEAVDTAAADTTEKLHHLKPSTKHRYSSASDTKMGMKTWKAESMRIARVWIGECVCVFVRVETGSIRVISWWAILLRWR